MFERNLAYENAEIKVCQRELKYVEQALAAGNFEEAAKRWNYMGEGAGRFMTYLAEGALYLINRAPSA